MQSGQKINFSAEQRGNNGDPAEQEGGGQAETEKTLNSNNEEVRTITLYHYTSLDNLQQILETGQINLTASNLLKPKAPHLENGNFVDETDGYKPVVWFSSLLDFRKAIDCGLYVDKTEVAIQIRSPGKPLFLKWDKWAKENRIDPVWFETLKKAAPLWNTFYITESPVKIDSTTGIIFRPDIKEKLSATEIF